MQTDATSYNIGSPTMLGVVGSCCVVVVVVVVGGGGYCTKGARSRYGLLYPNYFWNQRRDGRGMQNVHEAFSGEIGREGR